MNNNSPRPAIFVDRDGTLIEEVNFLANVEDLSIFDYTAEALRILKELDYLIIVVTNQSGIGRGIYDTAAMHSIHDEMQRRLGGAIDAFYFCPHLPDEGCKCRKPGLGMIDAALRQFEIDLARSWMVGDKTLDIQTGLNAGIKTAMVMTGYGRRHISEQSAPPHITAENLIDAAREIVRFSQDGI